MKKNITTSPTGKTYTDTCSATYTFAIWVLLTDCNEWVHWSFTKGTQQLAEKKASTYSRQFNVSQVVVLPVTCIEVTK